MDSKLRGWERVKFEAADIAENVAILAVALAVACWVLSALLQ